MAATITLANFDDVTRFDIGMVIEIATTRRYGATRKTLLKRTKYGGRKAKRAAARLTARLFDTPPATLTVTGVDRESGLLSLDGAIYT